jgi:hypothetical protein
MVSRTGWRCDRARLITFRTSLVAVWYSSASLSSRVLAFTSSKRAHVFDGDHRLIGERRDEFDLALGIGPRHRLRHEDDAHDTALAQERDTQGGSVAADFLSLSPSVAWIGQHVGQMDHLRGSRSPSDDASLVHRYGYLPKVSRYAVMGFGPVPEPCRPPQELAIPQKQPCMVGIAQPRCRLDQRVEHRLQIEGRAADDPQHVGRRRLLLQGFRQFRRACPNVSEQPRVLDGDDRLVRECAHEPDLRLRKWCDDAL